MNALTIAPVTIVVFSSANPTVVARLICPEAAHERSATIVRARTLPVSLGLRICNDAAAKINAACTAVVNSSQLRFRTRARCARLAKTRLPAQNLG